MPDFLQAIRGCYLASSTPSERSEHQIERGKNDVRLLSERVCERVDLQPRPEATMNRSLYLAERDVRGEIGLGSGAHQEWSTRAPLDWSTSRTRFEARFGVTGAASRFASR